MGTMVMLNLLKKSKKKAISKEQASWLDPNKNKSVVPGRLTPEAFSRRE